MTHDPSTQITDEPLGEDHRKAHVDALMHEARQYAQAGRADRLALVNEQLVAHGANAYAADMASKRSKASSTRAAGRQTRG